MIKLELKTKIGTFIIETTDKKLKSRINKMKNFKVINKMGKEITLFENILKNASIEVI